MVALDTVLGDAWQTPPLSGGEGACFEMRYDAATDRVHVRHSKRPDAEVIEYTRAEYEAMWYSIRDHRALRLPGM